MKKAMLVVGFLALFSLSCATVNVTTPPGSNVRIAAKGTPGPVGCMLYGEKRNMYLLWGLVPIGDNSTQTIMPKSGKVVVQTQMTFIDWALSTLANAILPTTLYFNSAKVYKCD